VIVENWQLGVICQVTVGVVIHIIVMTAFRGGVTVIISIENVDWKWIDEGKIWTRLDDKCREYPCAEYDWDPDGYKRDINPHVK
jgi:hypothetical protein